MRLTSIILLSIAFALSTTGCKKEETTQAPPPPDLTGMVPYSDSVHGLTLNVPKTWTTPKRVLAEDQHIVSEMPGDLWLKEPWESETAGQGVLLVRSAKAGQYSFQEMYDATKAALLNLQLKEISDTPLTLDGHQARQFIYTEQNPNVQYVDVFIARPAEVVRLRIAFPSKLTYKYSQQADAIVKTIKFH